MNLSKLFNFNAYVDGQGLVGKASEVTLPEIVVAMADSAGAGAIGTIQIPSRKLEALTARILWDGYYREALVLGANPYRSHNVQLRGNVEVHNETGLAEEQPLVVQMTASFNGTPLGALVAQQSTTIEHQLRVTYIKVTLAGAPLIEIDVHNAVWVVDGVDVLATYRRNLGL